MLPKGFGKMVYRYAEWITDELLIYDEHGGVKRKVGEIAKTVTNLSMISISRGWYRLSVMGGVLPSQVHTYINELRIREDRLRLLWCDSASKVAVTVIADETQKGDADICHRQ